ncbi:hypothetical protein HRbin06_00372 [archaeon HR06]|nr:hypothetical protein HRbin06_00372 [archaeon HR06]
MLNSFGKLEYFISLNKFKILILTLTLFLGYNLFFILSSWFNLAIRGINGAPNKIDFFFNSLVNLWSSDSELEGKVIRTLISPIYSVYSYSTYYINWAFQLNFISFLSLLSLTFLISVYINLWIFLRNCNCKVRKKVKVTSLGSFLSLFSSSSLSSLIAGGCCPSFVSLFSVIGLNFGSNLNILASFIGLSILTIFIFYSTKFIKIYNSKNKIKGILFLVLGSILIYLVILLIPLEVLGLDKATYISLFPTGILLIGFGVRNLS